MRYLHDVEKPVNFYKRGENIYIGQWDENFEGYAVNLKDLSEDLQEKFKIELAKKFPGDIFEV